jgi:hypothetical protein
MKLDVFACMIAQETEICKMNLSRPFPGLPRREKDDKIAGVSCLFEIDRMRESP